MERLTILAAFALAMGTCIPEPVETQIADCSGSNCARPEPAPFQTAQGWSGDEIGLVGVVPLSDIHHVGL